MHFAVMNAEASIAYSPVTSEAHAEPLLQCIGDVTGVLHRIALQPQPERGAGSFPGSFSCMDDDHRTMGFDAIVGEMQLSQGGAPFTEVR